MGWVASIETVLTLKTFCIADTRCLQTIDRQPALPLQWSVVLERSVPIWMSPVRPVFLPMSTEPKLAHKRQEQRRTHGYLPLKVRQRSARIGEHASVKEDP